MDNSLARKPAYTAHRRAASAADSSDLVALLATHERGAVSAKGFSSLQGFVEAATGASVTLIPLELVEYEEPEGTKKMRFVVRGAAIGPLADGATFDVPTPGGGRWFLRASAVTTTGGSVFLAGGTRANEGSI